MLITRKMIEEFEKEKMRIKETEDRIVNCEMVLNEWRKIGEHFINNDLMVWGDILPQKSLGIIKEIEKENTKLKKQLAITKEKIIEVLDSYKRSLGYSEKLGIYSDDYYINDEDFKQIASEILGDDKNDKSE